MKTVLLSVSIIILSTLLGGLAAHYYITYNDRQDNSNIVQTFNTAKEDNITAHLGSLIIKVFYPDNSTIAYSELKMQIDNTYALKPLELAFVEFSKKISKQYNDIKIHNIYKDNDNVIYIDISGAIMQKPLNTLQEYNIIHSILKTVASNADFAESVKILIDGKEQETLSGHISIMHPIKLHRQQ